MKDKCCGNCKHMENQDLDGFGWCEKTKTETHCELSCDCYESLSGWTEITPDNVDGLYGIPANRLVIGWIEDNMTACKIVINMSATLNTMAKFGGYYYYVLPELKIE